MTGKKKKVGNQTPSSTSSTTRASRSTAGTTTDTTTGTTTVKTGTTTTTGNKSKSSLGGGPPSRPTFERSLRGYPTTTTGQTSGHGVLDKVTKMTTVTSSTVKKDDAKLKARQVEEDFFRKRTSRSTAAAAGKASGSSKMLEKDGTSKTTNKDQNKDNQEEDPFAKANLDDFKKSIESEPLKSPSKGAKKPSEPAGSEDTTLKPPKLAKRPSESEQKAKKPSETEPQRVKKPSESEETPLKPPKIAKKPSESEPQRAKKPSESEETTLKPPKMAKKPSESEETPLKPPKIAKKPSELGPESTDNVKKASDGETEPLKLPGESESSTQVISDIDVENNLSSISVLPNSKIGEHFNLSNDLTATVVASQNVHNNSTTTTGTGQITTQTSSIITTIPTTTIPKTTSTDSTTITKTTSKTTPIDSTTITKSTPTDSTKISKTTSKTTPTETDSTTIAKSTPTTSTKITKTTPTDSTNCTKIAKTTSKSTPTDSTSTKIAKFTPTDSTSTKISKSTPTDSTSTKIAKTTPKSTPTETDSTTIIKSIPTTKIPKTTSKTTPSDSTSSSTTIQKTIPTDSTTITTPNIVDKSTVISTINSNSGTSLNISSTSISSTSISSTTISNPTTTTTVGLLPNPNSRAGKRKKSVNNFLKIASGSPGSPSSIKSTSTSEPPSPLLKKVLEKSTNSTCSSPTQVVTQVTQVTPPRTPVNKRSKTDNSMDKYIDSPNTSISTPSPCSSDGSAGGPKIIKKGDTVIESYVDETSGKILAFEAGIRLEVQDADPSMKDVWYPSKVVLVNNITREILVHYDNWNTRHDSWIAMDSPRIRPTASTNIVKLQYKVDERIEAFWVNGVRYPGVIKSVLPKDKYEILFEDGIKCVKKHTQIFKIKSAEPAAPVEVEEKARPPKLEIMPSSSSKRLRAPPPLKPLVAIDDLKQNVTVSAGKNDNLETPVKNPEKKDDLNSSTITTTPGPGESLNLIIGEDSSPQIQGSGSGDLGKRKRNIHNYSLLLKTRHKKSFDDEDYSTGTGTSGLDTPSPAPGGGSELKNRRRSRKPPQNLDLSGPSESGQIMDISHHQQIPPLLTPQLKPKQPEFDSRESINFVSPTALKRKKVSLKGKVVKRVGKGWRKGWKLDKNIGRLLPATPSAKSSSIQEVVQEKEKVDQDLGQGGQDLKNLKNLEPGEMEGEDCDDGEFDDQDDTDVEDDIEMVEVDEEVEERSADSDEVDELNEQGEGPHKRKKKRMREPIIPQDPNILNIPPAPHTGYRCEKLKLKIEDVNEVNLQQIVNDPEGIIFELNDPKPEGWRKEAQIKYQGEKFPKWFISYISPAGDRFRYKKIMMEAIQEEGFDFTPFDFRPLNPKLQEIANLVSGGMYSYKRRANMPPPDSFIAGGLVETGPGSPATDLASPSSTKGTCTIMKTPTGLGLGSTTSIIQTPPTSTTTIGSIKSKINSKSSLHNTPTTAASLASPGAVAVPSPALVETGPKESGFVDEQGNPLIIEQSVDGWLCPVSKCGKHHRKEHLLQMHIKHYHPELKMQSNKSKIVNVVQMAQARTVFEYNEEQHQHQYPTTTTSGHTVSGPNDQITSNSSTLTADSTTIKDKETSSTSSSTVLRRTRSSRSSTSSDQILPVIPPLLVGKKLQKSHDSLASGTTDTIIEDKIIVELSHYDDPPQAHLLDKLEKMEKIKSPSASSCSSEKSSRSRTRSSSSSRRKEIAGIPGIRPIDTGDDRLDVFLNETNIDPIISLNRLDEREINLVKNRRLRDRKRSTSGITGTSGGLKRHPDLEDSEEMEIDVKKLIPSTTRKRAGNKLPSSADNSFELDADSILNGLSSSHVKKLQQKLYARGSTSKKLKNMPHDVKVLVINCICNIKYEFGLMIQCELCQTWQHGNCFGIENGADLPKYYICDSCKIPQGLKKSHKFDFSQEFFRNGRLPCLSFGPKPDPVVERELKDLFGLLGKLSNMKEDVRSAKMRLKLAQEDDHPKIYQWDKPQPNPIEQAKKEIYEKTYGPIIKKLLKKHKDDPGYLEKLKEMKLEQLQCQLQSENKSNDTKEVTQTTQENAVINQENVITQDGITQETAVITQEMEKSPVVVVEINEHLPKPEEGEISQNSDLENILKSTLASDSTTTNANATTTTIDTTTVTTTDTSTTIGSLNATTTETTTETTTTSENLNTTTTDTSTSEILNSTTSTTDTTSTSTIGILNSTTNSSTITDTTSTIGILNTSTSTSTTCSTEIESSTSGSGLLTNLSEVEKEIVATLNQNPEEFLKTIEDMTATADSAAAAAAAGVSGISGELNSELNLNIFNDDQLLFSAVETGGPGGIGIVEEPTFEYPTGPELPQRITKETCKENLIDSLFREQEIVSQELAEIQKRFKEITKEECSTSGEKSAEEIKMDKYRLFILLENLNLLKNITQSQ